MSTILGQLLLVPDCAPTQLHICIVFVAIGNKCNYFTSLYSALTQHAAIMLYLTGTYFCAPTGMHAYTRLVVQLVLLFAFAK